jgi:hypothetical protein
MKFTSPSMAYVTSAGLVHGGRIPATVDPTAMDMVQKKSSEAGKPEASFCFESHSEVAGSRIGTKPSLFVSLSAPGPILFERAKIGPTKRPHLKPEWHIERHSTRDGFSEAQRILASGTVGSLKKEFGERGQKTKVFDGGTGEAQTQIQTATIIMMNDRASLLPLALVYCSAVLIIMIWN